MRTVNNYFYPRPEIVVPEVPVIEVVGASISGSLKFNSGTYCPLTDKIYFAPWNYTGVLELDYTNFTWVNRPTGIISGVGKFSGAVHVGDKIVLIPLRSTRAAIFDPVTKITTYFGDTYSTNFKWYGGAYGDDGFVYCSPWSSPAGWAEQVLKIDPVNLTTELVGPILSGGLKFSGASLISENKIAFANRNYINPIVFDTVSQTVTEINDLGGATTNKFWSVQKTETGRFFICKSNFSQHLRVREDNLEAELFGTPSATNQGFYGAGLAPNQKIYTTPASLNFVEILDIDGGNVGTIATPVTGSEKWLGSPVLAPDGAFYYPPFNSVRILRISNIGVPRPEMFEFPTTLTDFHLTDWNIYQNRY